MLGFPSKLNKSQPTRCATQAEKKDPSIIDHVSNFYAEHPTLVKTLGAAALGIALSQIAKRQQG